MLPLRIAVCEDLPQDMHLLATLISESGLTVELETFSSGAALLAAFSKGKFDVIFMDIFLKGDNGVETASAIRTVDRHVGFIFTTIDENYTKESYRLNAYKYLLKPVSAADVAEALDIAQYKRNKRLGGLFTVMAEEGTVQLHPDEILYAEVYGYKTLIHTPDGVLETATPITALLRLMPPPRFIRCHRSYLVNLDHVKGVDGDFLMSNDDRVLIRVRDYRRIKATYEAYLFSKTEV